ncbi:MAG: hypothetical protein V3V33_05820 [Candidatus Lokiarchaeia archaeon]
MHILSNELERTKNRTLLLIKFLILGLISCFIVIIILTAYYRDLIKRYYSGFLGPDNFPGSLVPIYQELALIEIFWMIILLLSFIFMNTIIWYYISYDLIKKTVIIQKFDEKIDDDAIICYKCRTHVPSKIITKNSSGLTPIKIFNVNGYFCKKCYRHYFRISLGTIVLVPIIYFLYMPFTALILYLMNLSYIPTIHYIIQTSFPVFILSIFVIIIYAIYSSIKISKIYDIKN